MKETQDRKRCPNCDSEEIIPIVYGLPGPEMMEESLRGEIALGGCIVFPDNPEWLCTNCEEAWR